MEHKAILTVRTHHGVTVTLFTNGHHVWNGCTIPPVPLGLFLDAVADLKEWSAEDYRATLRNLIEPTLIEPTRHQPPRPPHSHHHHVDASRN